MNADSVQEAQGACRVKHCYWEVESRKLRDMAVRTRKLQVVATLHLCCCTLQRHSVAHNLKPYLHRLAEQNCGGVCFKVLDSRSKLSILKSGGFEEWSNHSFLTHLLKCGGACFKVCCFAVQWKKFLAQLSSNTVAICQASTAGNEHQYCCICWLSKETGKPELRFWHLCTRPRIVLATAANHGHRFA